MKAKKTFLITLVVIFFSSCTTFRPLTFDELKPTGELLKKLPSLEPKIDIQSLENAYSKGTSSTTGSAYTTKGAFGGLVTMGSATTVQYADYRINDVLLLLERDVKDNITKYIGESQGSIIFKLTNRTSDYIILKEKNPKALLRVLAYLGTTGIGIAGSVFLLTHHQTELGALLMVGSLTIPAIIALAASLKDSKGNLKYTDIIELECEIKDKNNNPVARYTGVGYSSYRGNDVDNVDRRRNANAVKDAMDKIKEKIDEDYEEIIKLLNK